MNSNTLRLPESNTPRPEGLSPSTLHWVVIMPSLAAAFFALAFVTFLAQRMHNEQQRQAAQTGEDLLWLRQSLQTQFASDLRSLETLAATLASHGPDSAEFMSRQYVLQHQSPELLALEYLDETNQPRWRAPVSAPAELTHASPAITEARSAASTWNRTALSRPLTGPRGLPILAIVSPVKMVQGGHLIAWVSLRDLLQQRVPWWISQHYSIALQQEDGVLIAERHDPTRKLEKVGRSVLLDLSPTGLQLTIRPYQATRGWEAAVIATLGVLTTLMLASSWALHRHMLGRQKAEAKLRQETAMRQAIEDSLVTGIHAMDSQGRIFYVNRTFCDMIGWSEEELLGATPPLPYWPPEEFKRNQAALTAMLSGDFNANGFQLRLMRKNGERFDVRIYVAPLLDGLGIQTGWISSIYDITELQHEKEALQAAHERFITVLNGLDSAVSVSHCENGELLLTNACFDRTFGLPATRGASCMIPLLPRSGDRPVDGEWFDAYRNRWYQIQSRRSVWVDGSAVWLDTAADITARKDEAERERQQNEQMQQTARLVSMGEMASSLAHELNQPLAAITSYASGCHNLLTQPQPDLAQLNNVIGKMGGQAKRAGQIIRGIREFVRRQEPHRSACRIDELIDTALSLLKAELQKNQVLLTLEAEANLPPLYADAVMLEQVLFNLMRNAIEAMRDTPVAQRQLTVRLVREFHQLKVQIIDRGAGIAPEQLEQLFKPFYTTKTTGMGMGLNICRSIIEHHQGRLWQEPNPGGGCRFIFTIPFGEEPLTHES